MGLRERIIRNTLLYTIPKFVSYGLNIIMLPILTRVLKPEDFGIVTLSMAVPSITVSVVSAGLTFSVPRFFFEYRNDENDLKALYFSAQAYLATGFLFSGACVYVLRDWLSFISIGDYRFGNAVFVAYIGMYLGQMNLLYLRIFQSMEKAALHSGFVILQSAASLLIGVALVLYFDLTFMGLLYGTLAGAALSFIPMAYLLNRSGAGFFNGRILSECVKYGIQVVPKSFTGFVNRFFDKYMLNAMFSTQTVGVYNIGQTVANSLDSLGSNLWMSFQPTVYAEVFDKGQAASTRVGKIFTNFAYATTLPLILCALFAENILNILAPPAFHEAAGILAVLAAGVSTQALGIAAGVQFAYSKRPFWIFPSTVLGTCVNVALNLILIPRIGLMGAGMAAAGGMVAVNFLLALIGQRLYRIKYEYRSLAEFYSLMALASLVSLTSLPYQGFLGVTVMAAYLLSGVKAGVITRELPMLIKNSLRPSSLNGKKA